MYRNSQIRETCDRYEIIRFPGNYNFSTNKRVEFEINNDI